jgi:hypothetical protein
LVGIPKQYPRLYPYTVDSFLTFQKSYSKDGLLEYLRGHYLKIRGWSKVQYEETPGLSLKRNIGGE